MTIGGGESRRELDGDFISPSFPRRRESNRAFGAVIIALAIIAAFLLFARSANHLAKQDGKMRLCAGRLCRPLITGGFRRRRGFAIFGDKSPFALRANRKMAKGWIPAVARMTGI